MSVPVPSVEREGDTAAALGYVARQVGFRNVARYAARAGFVFKGIPIKDRRVIDIGCGHGAMALWTALHGASSVLALEPHAAGSDQDSLDACSRQVKSLRLGERVTVSPTFLQNLQPDERRFDIAILYDVINHLDESAVTELHHDEPAARTYIGILSHLRQLLAPGAHVIVADCGRENLWKRLGVRNPIARSIEWHKHQQPETWIALFGRAGFEFVDLRWSPLYPLGRLSSNRVVQYATASHFVLRFRSWGDRPAVRSRISQPIL